MEKRIPYGKTDYKELIEQNCYYVDKTALRNLVWSKNDVIPESGVASFFETTEFSVEFKL